MLLKEYPKVFALPIEHTSKAPGPGEENGKQAYFVSETEFRQLAKDEKFLSAGGFRGVARVEVERITAEKKVPCPSRLLRSAS
jgi:guanylate kinase